MLSFDSSSFCSIQEHSSAGPYTACRAAPVRLTSACGGRLDHTAPGRLTSRFSSSRYDEHKLRNLIVTWCHSPSFGIEYTVTLNTLCKLQHTYCPSIESVATAAFCCIHHDFDQFTFGCSFCFISAMAQQMLAAVMHFDAMLHTWQVHIKILTQRHIYTCD